MISGDGPCRLGQYPWLFRAVLDGKGHSDVPIFNASQDPRFYEHFGLVPAEFQRRAWVGTVASDLLYRKGRHVRSRASDRTRADQEYERGLADLEGALERGEDPRASLVHGFDRLEALPTSCAAPEVTIAVLGENYIRCNPVANADLAESLEALGAEVWFPSLCEWVMYTNWTARLHCRYERQPRRLLRLLAIDAIQRRDIGRISAAVRGRLPDTGFPTVTTLLRLAEPYVPASFEGETVWGVGRTVDFCRRGVGGVIHVAPFGCMVGGVVESLGHRLSADLGGFPMLHLQYDGRPDEHPAGLLEGFVHRARAWQDRPSDPRAGLARSRDRSREARA
jgi:predicted nucleotide-binding protein (sugar kinase/HSP70/actin superfamily)